MKRGEDAAALFELEEAVEQYREEFTSKENARNEAETNLTSLGAALAEHGQDRSSANMDDERKEASH